MKSRLYSGLVFGNGGKTKATFSNFFLIFLVALLSVSFALGTASGDFSSCDDCNPGEPCDADADGYAAIGGGCSACISCGISILDCDDAEAAVNPGESEEGCNCFDGLDNDCNGDVDDLDSSCACMNGQNDNPDPAVDCADPACENEPYCAYPETGTVCGWDACSDGFDNDGDGLTDSDDPTECSLPAECIDPANLIIDAELEVPDNALSMRRDEGIVEIRLPAGDLQAYGNLTFSCAQVSGFIDDYPSSHGVEQQGNNHQGQCGDDEVYWSSGSSTVESNLRTCGYHDTYRLELCYTCECPKVKIDIVTSQSNTSTIRVGGQTYQSGEWIPLADCSSTSVVATKIMCPDEDDLPNWGGGGPDVTSSTAEDFLADNPDCWLARDWSFQWAQSGTENPGDNTGEAGGNWSTFGPTNGSGTAAVMIAELNGADRIWVREVFKPGYLEFSGAEGGDVSAELYCHEDVLNYDNYDYIGGPQENQTYYCVAFNVPEEVSHTECNYETLSCEAVQGPGEDECASFEDCPQHTECDYEAQACAIVEGEDEDECATYDDCFHDICDYGQLACVTEPVGVQGDSCSQNSDCFHTVCDYGQEACVQAAQNGTDECATYDDCVHTECNYDALTCDVMFSHGTDECSSDSDCYHFICDYNQVACLKSPDFVQGDSCSQNSDCYHDICDYEQMSCVNAPANESGTACSQNSDCYHDICDYEQLACVTAPANESGDSCSEDSNCYHLECQGRACVIASGGGEDACQEDIDCIEDVCDPDAELLSNGGFESPAVTHEKNWNIFDNGTPGLAWSVEWETAEPSYGGEDRPETPSLEIQAGVQGWTQGEGSQNAELDGDWDGPGGGLNNEPASTRISQDIPTVPGETYTISFMFSPRPDTDAANNELEVKADGVVLDTISGAGSSDTDWQTYSYSFVATSTVTALEFADIGEPDAKGTLLDNVSARCVPPEPVCGNGVVESGEECDDGNNVSGDGCTNCILDTHMECNYELSMCEEAVGNGTDECENFTQCVHTECNYNTLACETVMEPGEYQCETFEDCYGCVAVQVVEYFPGTQKGGDPLPPERANGSEALGVPEMDDSMNFASLGFGGNMTLEFAGIIVNGSGDDFVVVETSYGSPPCGTYPETVHAYASQDGASWEDLGTGCLDSSFDLGPLTWARYVRLVDETDPDSFGNPSDAYDVDGVLAKVCEDPSAVPDLTVSVGMPESSQQGDNVTIDNTVCNEGGQNLTNVTVHVYLDGSLLTVYGVSVDANSCVNATENWVANKTGQINITKIVDLNDTVQELDESNNEGSASMSVTNPSNGDDDDGDGNEGGGALTTFTFAPPPPGPGPAPEPEPEPELEETPQEEAPEPEPEPEPEETPVESPTGAVTAAEPNWPLWLLALAAIGGLFLLFLLWRRKGKYIITPEFLDELTDDGRLDEFKEFAEDESVYILGDVPADLEDYLKPAFLKDENKEEARKLAKDKGISRQYAEAITLAKLTGSALLTNDMEIQSICEELDVEFMPLQKAEAE